MTPGESGFKRLRRRGSTDCGDGCSIGNHPPPGCIFRRSIDSVVMDLAKETHADEWAVGNDVAAKLDLFTEVGAEMKAAARSGIRRVLRRDPDEHDVEDVVVHAFNELWRKDLSEVKSRVGLARTIAKRRGLDRGGRLLRERRQSAHTHSELLHSVQPEISEASESEYATIMEIIRRCSDHLTVDQREVIFATVEGTIDGPMPLDEFARIRGTTYEACRRMCKRGIAALSRCVNDALGNGAGQ